MTPKRLVMALGFVVLITSLIILILIFNSKSTVVEFNILTKRIAFTVLPPRPPHENISFLYESLNTQSLEWHGAEKLEFELAEPVPRRVDMLSQANSVVQLKSETPFTPELKLKQPMRLTIRPYRKNHLVIDLQPANTKGTGWHGEVRTQGGLKLKLRNIEGSIVPIAADSVDGTYHIKSVSLAGGRWETKLGLQLVLQKPVTRLTVINPQTGEVSDPMDLDLNLKEDRLIVPLSERIAIFEKKSENPAAGQVLHLNIDVQNPEFYRLIGLEADSYVLGGRIQFPAGEKKAVDLQNGFYLSVDSREHFKLKSLHIQKGHLALVLWGKPSSISLGPTLGLMSEHLPSYFDWLYTHKLGTLVFTVIAWVVGACIGLLKLIGFIKS